MEVQGLPGMAALVELPAHAAPVSIRAAFGYLLRLLGVPKDTPRAALPHLVPAAAAVSLLQLLSANLPEDVDLQEAAAALCPSGAAAAGHVGLDALLGLSCLLSSGRTQDKLQLCFWTLDRDSSGSLDLQQLLGLIPAAQQASCAARILTQQATLQALSQEAADPRAAADRRQGEAVLREVLSRAFVEADPRGSGLIQPGEQLTQLLFAVAAQLTSLMVGATALSREGTAGYGSRASSASTTPPASVSASPVRQHYSNGRQPSQHHHQQPSPWLAVQQPQQQQQVISSRHMQVPQQLHLQQPAAAAPKSNSTPPTPGAALAEQHSIGDSTAMADVVIMDAEGGVLHYQAPVEHAAAAACQGRVPVGAGAGGMRVYGPDTSRNSLTSMGGVTPQQGLTPAGSSLLQHLELLEAQQQQQQQQQQQAGSTSAAEEPALFLTPNGTVSAEDGTAAGSGDGDADHTSPFVQQSYQQSYQQQHRQPPLEQQAMQSQQQAQQHHQQQHASVSRRVLRPGLSQLNLRSGSKSSPGSSANNSLRRLFVGSPFGTISESVNAGGTSSSAEAGRSPGAAGDPAAAAAGGAAAAAVPATAAGAITHTATNVMTTIQSNVLAVVVKLLLHCGMCCLITMMVALGDAAIVAGLHVGARLPLSVSFAVAVAANMVLVLVLLGLLLVARMLNAANNDRLAEMANRPEAQQLDQILETMKAAVAALKTTEQQQQQQGGGLALGPGSASQRFTGSQFLASRASSMRGDVEQGGRQGAGAGGLGGAGSGPLAVAGKLRAVWSAVGRVAGFLPPAQQSGASETAIAGPFGSAVALDPGVAAGQHSSTSWGASSGPEGVATSPPAGPSAAPHAGRADAAAGGRAAGSVPGQGGGGGGGTGVRPVSPQSRQLRVAGTAAPQSAPGASPVALREAYPQL